MTQAAVVYDWVTNIRSGGPTGYLANLKLAVSMADVRGVEFITHSDESQKKIPSLGVPGVEDLVEVYDELDEGDQSLVQAQAAALISELEQPEEMFFTDKIGAHVTASEATIFHVHTTLDCIRLHNQLTLEGRRHEVKIVLTSHCPEAPARERADLSFSKTGDPKLAEAVFTNSRLIDRLAFVFADALLFPCKEAFEPYEATLPGFLSDLKHKPTYFLPTAAAPLKKSALVDPKTKFGLSDRFVVCYLGRHNSIKGYSFLKRAAVRLLQRNQDISFLIAGEPGPIAPLDHPSWIEHGWTATPEDLIAASDVFVLPNRLTYFDLVLIEALSAGRIVLAANNGGSRYLAGRSSGVVLFDNEADFIEKIEWIRGLSRAERNRMAEDNLRLYRSEFRIEDFGRRYAEVIQTIATDFAVKPPGSLALDSSPVDISVIVPVFNVEDCLAKCLDSILAQDHPSFEIIVVNDGSTDGSANVLERYAEDRRLRVIRQENAGLSAARNTGLLHACGEYVCFVDSDDYVEPTYLSALHKQSRRDGTDICFCEIYEFHESGERRVSTIHNEKSFIQGQWGRGVRPTPEFVSSIYPSAWNKLFRKRLFEQTNFPKGLLYEDNPVHFELMLRQERVSFVARPLYWHRVDRSTRISKTSSHRMLEIAMVASLVHSVVAAETNPMTARRVSARILTRLFWERFWSVKSREIELNLTAALNYLYRLFKLDAGTIKRALDPQIERSFVSDRFGMLARLKKKNGNRFHISLKKRLTVRDRSILSKGQEKLTDGQVSPRKGAVLIHPDPQALVIAELTGLGLFGLVRYEFLLRLENEKGAATEVRIVATQEPLSSEERLRAIDDALGWGAVATDWARLKGDSGVVFTLDLEEFGPCATFYVMARTAGEGAGFAWLHLRKIVVSRLASSDAGRREFQRPDNPGRTSS